MILSALLPELAGAAAGWAAVGWAGAAPLVAAAAPQDVQNCSLADIAEPHLAQKLAMVISLSLSSCPGAPMLSRLRANIPHNTDAWLLNIGNEFGGVQNIYIPVAGWRRIWKVRRMLQFSHLDSYA
jgi:hypothetical protein